MGSISTRIDVDYSYLVKKPETTFAAPVIEDEPWDKDTDVEVDDEPVDDTPEFGGINPDEDPTVLEDPSVEVEVDDDPTVLEPEFGASVIEDEDPVEVEVDDDPTVDEPVFGADVKDKAPVEVDDDPTVDEPVLGAGDTGILTSWVATEEPKKGKGGKKKKN